MFVIFDNIDLLTYQHTQTKFEKADDFSDKGSDISDYNDSSDEGSIDLEKKKLIITN